MAKKNPLETYEMEHRRAEQLADNCRWLIGITDAINEELCPGELGTWQQRAEFALKAARKIGQKRREKTTKKFMKKAQKHIEILEKTKDAPSDLQFDSTTDRGSSKTL